MIPQFHGLEQEEVDLMYNSFALITLLIGGADGKLDEDEQNWAAKITHIRSFTNEDSLKDFYQEVNDKYQEKLNKLSEGLPADTEARNQSLSDQLSGLNAILAKLEEVFAARLYRDMRSFAKQVAKASGGFLSIGSISKAEKAWIELPMITPVVSENLPDAPDPYADEEE
ncbi:MAG: hypothetical protein AAFV25_03775 [Bacteroidota bacterium]